MSSDQPTFMVLETQSHWVSSKHHICKVSVGQVVKEQMQTNTDNTIAALYGIQHAVCLNVTCMTVSAVSADACANFTQTAIVWLVILLEHRHECLSVHTPSCPHDMHSNV